MGHSFYEMCDYFEYLDDLRVGGNTNMFGAAPYLASAYGLDIHDARSVTQRWRDTFSEDDLEDRVHLAQTK